MDPLSPDRLVEHAASLRALARRLVQDEARADDVVQETWVIALARAPGSVRQPFAWLATVARRVAGRMARDDERREERERWRDHERFAPTPDEALEHARVQRELMDALLSLEEPYRTVLVYRYLEDLPPRRIAREMCTKATTVHTWIGRGREQLRRKLTARHGSASSWCSLLAAWAFLRPGRAVATATTTVVVSTGITLAVAATVVLGAVWTVGGGARPGAEDREPAPPALVRPGGGEERGSAAVERESPARDAIELPVRARAPRVETLPREPVDPAALKEEIQGLAAPHPPVRTTLGTPPGLVRVRGGRVGQGDVEGFYAMATEVTNEQYAAYVAATGASPPVPWLTSAESGRPADWPALPVVGVSLEEAEAYARWAGLRLLDVSEYARAARGDSRARYPWGDAWEGDRCNSQEAGGRLAAVGSHPLGSFDGLHDLVGNAAEWVLSMSTSSLGHESAALSAIGYGLPAAARQVPAYRSEEEWYEGVLAGGSFLDDREGCEIRCARPTDASTPQEARGFRCAASLETARTIAAKVVLEPEISLALEPLRDVLREANARRAVRGAIHVLDVRAATGVFQWEWSQGTADVPGYAVIHALRRALFIPRLALEAEAELVRASKPEDRVVLGLLVLDHPLVFPKVEAGAYFLTWRRLGSGANPVSLFSLCDLQLRSLMDWTEPSPAPGPTQGAGLTLRRYGQSFNGRPDRFQEPLDSLVLELVLPVEPTGSFQVRLELAIRRDAFPEGY